MPGIVRSERTGWRDEGLSRRHRRWGYDCPAIDLDFLALEYDRGKATAIVEYKNEHAAPAFPTHPSYRAMVDLGDRASLPVFGVRYASDFSWFRVTPLNDEARRWVPSQVMLGEREWVTLLYEMRGYQMPDAIFEGGEVEL